MNFMKTGQVVQQLFWGRHTYIPNITDTYQYDDSTQSKESETNTKSYSMKPSSEQINSEKWVTECLFILYFTSYKS
jgi:hypothetical protein